MKAEPFLLEESRSSEEEQITQDHGRNRNSPDKSALKLKLKPRSSNNILQVDS